MGEHGMVGYGDVLPESVLTPGSVVSVAMTATPAAPIASPSRISKVLPLRAGDNTATSNTSDSARRKVSEYKAAHGELIREHIRATYDNESLTRHLQGFEMEVDELRVERQTLATGQQCMAEALDKERTEVARLRMAKDEVCAEVALLSSECEALRNENRRMTQAANTALQGDSAEVARLSECLAEATQRQQLVTANEDALQQTISSLNEELRSKAALLLAADAVRATLLTQLEESKSSTPAALLAEVEELRQKDIVSKAAILGLENANVDLQMGRNGKSSAELEASREQAEELRRDLEDAVASSVRQGKELERQRSATQQATRELARVKKHLAELQQSGPDCAAVMQLQAEVAGLKAESSKAEAQQSRLRSELRTLQSEKGRVTEMLAPLEEELSRMQTENGVSAGRVITMEADLGVLRAERDHLRKCLKEHSAKQKEAVELENHLASLQTELLTLKTTVEGDQAEAALARFEALEEELRVANEARQNAELASARGAEWVAEERRMRAEVEEELTAVRTAASVLEQRVAGEISAASSQKRSASAQMEELRNRCLALEHRVEEDAITTQVNEMLQEKLSERSPKEEHTAKLKAALEQTETELQEIRTRLEVALHQVADKELLVAKLEDTYTTQLQEAKAAREQSADSADQMRAERDKASVEVLRLSALHTSLQEAVQSQQTALSEAELASAELKRSLLSAQTARIQAETLAEDMSLTLGHKDAELVMLRKVHASCEANATAQEEEITQIKEHHANALEACEAELQRLQVSAAHTESARAQDATALNTVTAERNKLLATLENLHQSEDKYTALVKTSAATEESLHTRVSGLLSQLELADTQSRHGREGLVQCEREMSEMKGRHEQECEGLRAKLAEFTEEVRVLQMQAVASETQMEQVQSDLKKKTEESAARLATLQTHEKSDTCIDSLRQELRRLEKHLTSQKGALETALKERQEIIQQISDTNADLSATSAKLRESEAHRTQLATKLQHSQNEVLAATLKATTFEEKAHSAEVLHRTLKAEVEILEAQVQTQAQAQPLSTQQHTSTPPLLLQKEHSRIQLEVESERAEVQRSLANLVGMFEGYVPAGLVQAGACFGTLKAAVGLVLQKVDVADATPTDNSSDPFQTCLASLDEGATLLREVMSDVMTMSYLPTEGLRDAAMRASSRLPHCAGKFDALKIQLNGLCSSTQQTLSEHRTVHNLLKENTARLESEQRSFTDLYESLKGKLQGRCTPLPTIHDKIRGISDLVGRMVGEKQEGEAKVVAMTAQLEEERGKIRTLHESLTDNSIETAFLDSEVNNLVNKVGILHRENFGLYVHTLQSKEEVLRTDLYKQEAVLRHELIYFKEQLFKALWQGQALSAAEEKAREQITFFAEGELTRIQLTFERGELERRAVAAPPPSPAASVSVVAKPSSLGPTTTTTTSMPTGTVLSSGSTMHSNTFSSFGETASNSSRPSACWKSVGSRKSAFSLFGDVEGREDGTHGKRMTLEEKGGGLGGGGGGGSGSFPEWVASPPQPDASRLPSMSPPPPPASHSPHPGMLFNARGNHFAFNHVEQP